LILKCSAFSSLRTSRVVRYGSAPVVVAAALGLRHSLELWFGSGLPPYITFYPAVMAVAVLAGFGPGAVATALSGVIAAYWIILPIGQFAIGSPIDGVALVIFIGMGMIMSLIAERYQCYHRKVAAYEREAALHSTKDTLRESENRFHTLFNTLMEGFCTLEVLFDANGRPVDYRFIEVNSAFEKQTGLRDAQGKRARELVPDHDPHWFEIFGKISLRSEPARFESEVRALGRWYDVSAYPVGGPDSRKVAVLFNDISDIKRAKEAAQQSELQLRSVLEHSRDVFYRRNVQTGRFVYISQSVQTLVGYTPDELMMLDSATLQKMIHPDDISAMWAALACLEKTGQAEAEYRQKTKDGEYRWLSNHMVIIRDGDGQSLYRDGSIRDITAQKSATAQIHKVQQRLEALMNAVPVGVSFSDDVTCQNVTGNPAVLEQFDVGAAENLSASALDSAAPGRQVQFFRDGCLISDSDLPLQRAVAENKMIPAMELEVRLPSGRIWYAQASGAPVRDAHGKVIAGIAVTVDITQRIHAEQALKAAKDEAERANHAKSRFLAAASHDLRQPLSAISIYADLLKSTARPSDQKIVANMQQCIDSLSTLLRDLLDLSKLEANVITPSITDFSVAELFSGLATSYQPESIAKGLRLHWVPTRLTGRTDVVLLRRLLGNLLKNALRYTERGGALIGCKRRQGKIWVEVWDTGIGIPTERTSGIFEEFKQLGDGSRNNGSGLGLAVVAKTAALLGLEIQVRSWPGRGSSFAIELPLGESNLVVSSAQPEPDFRPLRVALVEDNQMVRDALVKGLQRLGHQVLGTATKAALLAELEPFAPDIVVSDYRLTEGDTGVEVITAVRAQLGTEVPAILITGDTDPNLLRSIEDHRITVLHKPIDLETLQAYLEDLTYLPEEERMTA